MTEEGRGSTNAEEYTWGFELRDKGELWAKTLEPEQQGLRHHGAVWFWPQTNVSNRREWRSASHFPNVPRQGVPEVG